MVGGLGTSNSTAGRGISSFARRELAWSFATQSRSHSDAILISSSPAATAPPHNSSNPGRSVRNADNNNNNSTTNPFLNNTLASATVTIQSSLLDSEAEERQLALERGLEASHKARNDILAAFDYLLATGNVQLQTNTNPIRPNSRHSTIGGANSSSIGGGGGDKGDPLLAAAAAAGAAAAMKRRKALEDAARNAPPCTGESAAEPWHAQGRPSSRAVGLLMAEGNKVG